MEDILASIRRIIADDQTQGAKPAPAGAAARRPAAPTPDVDRPGASRTRTPYDDVLDLARLVPAPAQADQPLPEEPAMAEGVGTELATVQHAPDYDDHATASRSDGDHAVSGLRARLPEPVGRGSAQEEEHAMLDHAVPALGDESEEDLLSAPLGASVMSAFETLAATVVLQNTPMLERVMRDLLRPMLKTWLDDNLPGLVERLVRSEIERVARGSRG
jgi:cell pole-organizing protein PopZ